MSHTYRHCVLFTDFGTTLDLQAAEKDNSSVNNHAVICIFFVCTNWRSVTFSNGVDMDETILNDCERWIFFGDTLSKGKKNDHIFHNACTNHIIKYYDDERVEAGKNIVPINIVWTDNCPTQYKCRQNFWKVATSASRNKSIIVHKFAQKYRFKGPWDATGKLVKQAIQNNELRFERCANAWDCYIKLGRDLSRDGQAERTRKLLEYEHNQDVRVLNNTPFTTSRTHIGFGTEEQDEYNTLKLIHRNIVFTDRINIEDMNVVQNTLKISQVSGEVLPETTNPHEKWKLTTSLIPCSCPSCQIHPSCGACIYQLERGINAVIVGGKGERNNSIDDEFGISTMNVKQLKVELKERGLRTAGCKAELAARLVAFFEKDVEDELQFDEVDEDDDFMDAALGIEEEDI